MSVSAGPYNRLIPFVNAEEVLISQDPASDNLKVSLQLTNEIGQLSKKIIKFGNFVYLTTSATDAADLCADAERLTTMISAAGNKNLCSPWQQGILKQNRSRSAREDPSSAPTLTLTRQP